MRDVSRWWLMKRHTIGWAQGLMQADSHLLDVDGSESKWQIRRYRGKRNQGTITRTITKTWMQFGWSMVSGEIGMNDMVMMTNQSYHIYVFNVIINNFQLKLAPMIIVSRNVNTFFLKSQYASYTFLYYLFR